MTQQTESVQQALRPIEDEYILEAERQEALSGAASNLFDLRVIIGLLFAVYGVVLVVIGLLDGPDEVAKSAGIRINLWAGVGMLALAAVFLLWARLRPVTHELAHPGEDLTGEPAGARRPPGH